jgi:hypothetical protein
VSAGEPPETPSGADELVAELRKAKVEEFLVHTCSLLASLAVGKLEAGELDQARVAIDALKALQPLVPEETGRDLQQLVATLQLAYADATAGG